MKVRRVVTRLVLAGALGLAVSKLVQRYRHQDSAHAPAHRPTLPYPEQDPAHAPGHRHRGPAPAGREPASATGPAPRDQPWVRRSHSDSQQRRPRR